MVGVGLMHGWEDTDAGRMVDDSCGNDGDLLHSEEEEHRVPKRYALMAAVGAVCRLSLLAYGWVWC